MKIKTNTILIDEDNNGKLKVSSYTSMEEYPVDEIRPFYYCNVCGNTTYPDCREGCIHLEGYRIRNGKEPPI